MVCSTGCSGCGQELIFPDEWVNQSIQCPRCKAVVQLTPQLVGRNPDGTPYRAVSPRLAWSGVGITALLCLAFALPLGEIEPAIQDPPLELRCIRCSHTFKEDRTTWERDVLEALKRQQEETSTPRLTTPELVPLQCPSCQARACYLKDHTIPCPRCGHWMPIPTGAAIAGIIPSPTCPHCGDKSARYNWPR